MDLDQQLEKDYEEISLAQEDLKKRGHKLLPKVIAHFNDYLEKTLNPSLPQGFGVQKSCSGGFFNGKFIVYTGLYITPHGLSRGPLPIETKVIELLDKYRKATPWIEQIHYKFLSNKRNHMSAI